MKQKVLLLHDICGTGKAAAMNMIPVLNAMGIETSFLPTVLLSTHTGGYGKPAMEFVSPEFIRDCANHYVEQKIQFDAIFIGYLGTKEMVDAVLYLLSCFPNATVILDPILGDYGHLYRHFEQEYVEKLKVLLPISDIILPNLTEACLLSGELYKEHISGMELEHVCKKLNLLGTKDIVITGLGVYEQEKMQVLELPMLDALCHGTGDLFDGVFIGSYLKGKDIIDCVKAAHQFVYACIEESQKADFVEKEGLLFEKNLHLLV